MEKQPLVDLMNKVSESTLWMTFLLMMFNPFGLKETNVPFQNSVDRNSTLEACKDCPNHPSNGGSGNCNCMSGGLNVTY